MTPMQAVAWAIYRQFHPNPESLSAGTPGYGVHSLSEETAMEILEKVLDGPAR